MLLSYLSNVWSATEFDDPELAGYAEKRMLKDTRRGIQALAGLSLIMQSCVALLILSRGLSEVYLSSIVLFGLLSLHIFISAFYLNDVRTLHALGTAFLIIGALCLTILAHRSGQLPVGMMAATVMLFVAIPLVPWALREATIIVSLTYVMLMCSLVAVPGRFVFDSLLVFQMLMFGAALIGAIVTTRNTAIRKQDLRTRFELENARNELELLTMKDHLTGAWNRRYLSEKFADFAQSCLDKNRRVHVAILDIDHFKKLNDQHGHQFGDMVLVSIADIFIRLLGQKGRLIRLGGDEFQIIYSEDDLAALIETAIGELQQRFAEYDISGDRSITVSAGIVSSEPDVLADVEALYKAADSALYAEKERRRGANSVSNPLAHTGNWTL